MARCPRPTAAEEAGQDAPTAPPTGGHDFKCTPTGAVPNLAYENIVSVPGATEVAGPPGMLDTLLVIQHEQGILRAVDLKAKRLLEEPVTMMGVSTSGSREQGLLSIAFHPKFTENKLFYLFYSASMPAGQSMVDEYQLGADLKATKKRNVYTHPHPAGNHNGGSLHFGPDGMMYLGMGDNQQRAAAGGRDGRYGRILRFDAATGMPPATGNVAGWTYEYGLRNPYRHSFDLMTGDLYIGDVGDGTWEELNFAPAGKTGNDWGWTTNGDGRGSSPETEPVVRLPTRGRGRRARDHRRPRVPGQGDARAVRPLLLWHLLGAGVFAEDRGLARPRTSAPTATCSWGAWDRSAWTPTARSTCPASAAERYASLSPPRSAIGLLGPVAGGGARWLQERSGAAFVPGRPGWQRRGERQPDRRQLGPRRQRRWRSRGRRSIGIGQRARRPAAARHVWARRRRGRDVQ